MLDAWEGSSNLLWRVNSGGQEAVVKLYLDAGQARGRRQFDGQQMFSPLGLAPQPLWFDRYPAGLARQVLVYAWAPGIALEVTNAAHLAALAQSIAQVHSGDPTDVRRFCPNPLNLDYLWRVMHGGLGLIEQWLVTQKANALQRYFAAIAANANALVEAALPLWQHMKSPLFCRPAKLTSMLRHRTTGYKGTWPPLINRAWLSVLGSTSVYCLSRPSVTCCTAYVNSRLPSCPRCGQISNFWLQP
jgi:hypothetical protein